VSGLRTLKPKKNEEKSTKNLGKLKTQNKAF